MRGEGKVRGEVEPDDAVGAGPDLQIGRYAPPFLGNFSREQHELPGGGCWEERLPEGAGFRGSPAHAPNARP